MTSNVDLRLRMLAAANRGLTNLGVLPTPEKAFALPVDRRRAQRPPKWVLRRPPANVQSHAREIRGRNGTIPLRVYTPTEVTGQVPLVLFSHGGGWVTGGLDTMHHVCADLAAAGCIVVSVDYRLSPEDRYPAALHDVYDALCWTAEHGPGLGGSHRLAVVGDSAGGNLSAAVCLLARDAHGPAIAHQTLIYPGLDATLSSPSIDDGEGLTRNVLELVCAKYLGSTDPRAPLVSPLLATDLSGLPPALIQTGGLDPIRDDGRRYAEALRAAGVPVRYTNYVGMPHGYLSSPRLCRCYPQAMAEIIEEIGTATAALPA